jgi:NAD(P)-dependent dehydrogenase (short-subunit alcohol dehydrogenase family)
MLRATSTSVVDATSAKLSYDVFVAAPIAQSMTRLGGSMSKLDGKVAVVTGANSGIGFAAAKRLAGEGAHVFITGRRAAELDAAAREIGANATAVAGDVSRLADLDKLYALVKQAKGHIDILFANAGIAEAAPIGEISEDQYDRIFDVNVKGTLFTVQKALPLLADGASIILNSSIVGSKGFATNSVYSATKAALRSLARTWTSDLAPRRIRVNVVSPGWIDTQTMRDFIRADTETLRQIADRVPLGRIGQPDDVAKVVAFLAADDSGYVAGSEVFVDGGAAQV